MAGIAVVALGALVIWLLRDVNRVFALFLLVAVALLVARALRDLRRLVPGTSEEALRRRTVRGLSFAISFGAVALVTGLRDTTGDSAEDGFYQLFFVIVPCGLIAGWFASGAIAAGYAWLRTRRSGVRGAA